MRCVDGSDEHFHKLLFFSSDIFEGVGVNKISHYHSERRQIFSSKAKMERHFTEDK